MSGVTHDGKGWGNADQDRVELVAYDPSWPARYEAEAQQLRAVLAGIVGFELAHFGSTAIPGLVAKPIIDIMLIVPDQSAWPALVEPIEGLGYVFWADNPRRDRMFFVKGMPPYGARRTLAAPHSMDRDAYTEGKARYVNDVVRKADTR